MNESILELLKKVKQDCESVGELSSACVLSTLIASLYCGADVDMAHLCSDFSKSMLRKLESMNGN